MTDNLFAALEENNWAVDIHPDYSEQASKYKSLKTVSHN